MPCRWEYWQGGAWLKVQPLRAGNVVTHARSPQLWATPSGVWRQFQSLLSFLQWERYVYVNEEAKNSALCDGRMKDR